MNAEFRRRGPQHCHACSDWVVDSNSRGWGARDRASCVYRASRVLVGNPSVHVSHCSAPRRL